MNKKTIVLSGINLIEGGPLTIYEDCLRCVEKYFLENYEIVALVHNRELFSEFDSKIKFIEFMDSKKSYLKRFYYEYFYFKRLSKKLKPYLWFSLHDMTPNVVTDKRAVYCHNPIIFYDVKRKDMINEFKMFMFSRFYKYIYKINIKKNNFVVVQQDWIRKRFKKIFKIKNVVVAHPNVVIDDSNNNYKNTKIVKNSFLYPSFPRIFKNFEVICKAVEILENKNIENFKVYLTIDGSENIYSKEIVEKYGRLKCIEFIGLQTRENLMKYYSKIETVIFPSKLETWGLPISEAKAFGKNIILADLEYAHETLGTYEKVMFFGPDDAEKLAEKMEMLINDDENMKNIEFDGNIEKNIEKPFCKNWKELFDILLLDNR
ncbi:glycosyltransferase [Leptotrichia wadei]|jgi:uncharacterized protein yefI|uniref:glycosyltransferase n=1 Tax=Leptotrichia wadei TaxID=157687 RepID=UPI00352D6500